MLEVYITIKIDFVSREKTLYPYFLEKSLIENKLEDEKKMIPRLITKYFWLIDHYICSRNSRDKIEEILKKIKELDNSVYEMYVN